MKIDYSRLMQQHALRHGDRPALINVERNRRYTYREYHLLTNRIANMMRTTLGLGNGDNALFILENDSLSLVHYTMVFKQAATCAYTNLRDSTDEIRWQVDHVRPKAVFIETAHLDKFYDMLVERGCTIVVMDPPPAPRANVVSFWDAVDAASDAEPGVVLDDREHVAVLRFTGGTTGRGKCVMYTIDNLLATHGASYECDDAVNYDENTRFLHFLPLSHACIAMFGATLGKGGTNITMNLPDLNAWCRIVQDERCTHSFAVPTILYRLLDLPAARTADLSSLSCMVYGAAPMSPAKLQGLLERFGPIFVQAYGASENLSGAAMMRRKSHSLQTEQDRQHLASAGQSVSGTEVRICDDRGRPLPAGEPGEVWMRSRATVAGYYHNPEATAAEFEDGFWKSGDIGYLDADGFLFIVDRKKDMVVTGGFNVYAIEVEAAITTHAAVMMSAVIGIPHPEWGEAVHAEVIVRDGCSVTEEELILHVRSRLGGHKTPKSIRFVTELPVSAVGKVMRRRVREKYWQGQSRVVN
jgi:fatty-acyl-CoA synthase